MARLRSKGSALVQAAIVSPILLLMVSAPFFFWKFIRHHGVSGGDKPSWSRRAPVVPSQARVQADTVPGAVKVAPKNLASLKR